LEVTVVSLGKADADTWSKEVAVTSPAEAAIEAARTGDEAAFRILYRAIQPGMLRYLRGLGVGADAEDVASEAWLQISRDLSSFHGDFEGFRAWAVTVARHRALDHLRKVRRRPALLVSVDQLTDIAGSSDTEELVGEHLSTDEAVAMIATLPREQADAVLLRVVVGLDVAATAKVLGKRPGAVRTACFRGLRRLAEQLRDQGT
jgi:RNA polymerase sigma-70 factor (ECF subfamily)